MEKSYSPEHKSNHEPLADKSKELLKDKLELANNAERLDVNEARSAVDKLSSEVEVPEPTKAEEAPNNVSWWSKELGTQTFERTLVSVRRRLNPAERQFSKVIHNPAVEKTSDAVGKTIARPSGILFGGLFSFIASLGAYLLARHLGGELRFSIFAIAFVGGYVAGLLIELLWRLLKLKKQA